MVKICEPTYRPEWLCGSAIAQLLVGGSYSLS